VPNVNGVDLAAAYGTIASELRRRAGVAHVDADRVLDLLGRRQRLDPWLGWLELVETEIRRAVGGHDAVSVQATCAWTATGF
jgi:hypothetical protein